MTGTSSVLSVNPPNTAEMWLAPVGLWWAAGHLWSLSSQLENPHPLKIETDDGETRRMPTNLEK